jgi:hypothetical protein
MPWYQSVRFFEERTLRVKEKVLNVRIHKCFVPSRMLFVSKNTVFESTVATDDSTVRTRRNRRVIIDLLACASGRHLARPAQARPTAFMWYVGAHVVSLSMNSESSLTSYLKSIVRIQS